MPDKLSYDRDSKYFVFADWEESEIDNLGMGCYRGAYHTFEMALGHAKEFDYWQIVEVNIDGNLEILEANEPKD